MPSSRRPLNPSSAGAPRQRKPKRQRASNPLFAAAAAERTRENASRAEGRMKNQQIFQGQLAIVGKRALAEKRRIKSRRKSSKPEDRGA